MIVSSAVLPLPVEPGLTESPLQRPLKNSVVRCLRLFEVAVGGEILEDESPVAGPSLALKGQVVAHTDRATGVAATRRRCVTVGEDGAVCLFDLQRLDGGIPSTISRSGGSSSGGFAMWKGNAKGGLPLSGVAFQGESEEVRAFALNAM